MIDGPIRLRSRRVVSARRRSRGWRLPVMGGVFAVVIGAACWAPLAPTALAPSGMLDRPDEATAQPAPAVNLAIVSAAAAAVPVAIVPAKATPTPKPTVLPTPVIVPTLTAAGITVFDSIKSDRAAQWVKNHTETPLRSGPTEDAQMFTLLPQWSLLKQIDSKPDWLLVMYSGDGDTRLPGPGWVKATDVGAVDAPSVWLRSAKSTPLWSASDASGKPLFDLPSSTLLEVSSSAFIQGSRIRVRLPGNGRNVPPSEGWIDGDAIARAATPSWGEVPWAYPEDLHADLRLNVPYRTQLDGSDFAGANCGPTALGMALETFGVNLPPSDIRQQVLTSENFDPQDTDAGSFIWALADVAQNVGLRAHGLYEVDGALHRWNIDEIRTTLRAGQPVIAQVVYRGLPGRADSTYYMDHFIILTGLLGDSFLYNDPIGGLEAHEAPGYDRVITSAQLQRAMRASDTGYAFTAFSVSR